MNSDELLKQWQQDIADYGDNAYLWWEGWNDYGWETIGHNKFWTCPPEVRRKESAALPFDLERAKAGDEVESLWQDGVWRKYPVSVSRIRDGYITDGIFFHDDCLIRCENLRMKYPPKVNHNEIAECQALITELKQD